MADGKPLDSYQDAVTCIQCGFIFYGKHSLESHAQRFHQVDRKLEDIPAGPVSHSCELCGDVFYKLSALRGHVKLHMKEPCLTCGVCDRLFGKSDTLQKHMNIHGKASLMEEPIGGEIKPEGIYCMRSSDWADVLGPISGPTGAMVPDREQRLPGFGIVAAAVVSAAQQNNSAAATHTIIANPNSLSGMTTGADALSTSALNSHSNTDVLSTLAFNTPIHPTLPMGESPTAVVINSSSQPPTMDSIAGKMHSHALAHNVIPQGPTLTTQSPALNVPVTSGISSPVTESTTRTPEIITVSAGHWPDIATWTNNNAHLLIQTSINNL